MLKFLVSLLFVLCYRPECTNSANILAVFPFPGYSKYLTVRPYLEALAKRGHNLTVISPYPQASPVPNFYDITVQYDYYESRTYDFESEECYDMRWNTDFVNNVTVDVLKNHQVHSLLYPKDQDFQLVIIEVAFSELLFAIGPHFGAHLIGVSLTGIDPYIDRLVGNLSPVASIPHPRSGLKYGSLNMYDRFVNLKTTLKEWLYYYYYLLGQRWIYRTYFPDLQPTFGYIATSFSLVLLNQHFSISHPRSYVPNMIEVGGMHIDHEPKNLPDDLQHFINGAEHGVIYFSTPSLHIQEVDAKLLRVFTTVFASLKQLVLWRYHGEPSRNITANVLMRKDFPHWDVLNHPNVRLYITHGDMESTMEAVYFAKPIYAVPIFVDQKSNTEYIKDVGLGLGCEFKSLEETNIAKDIKLILGDSKFTKNVQEISDRFHDQPQNPLDKAIFWTEYILRHDGAEFIRVPTNLNFFAIHSISNSAFAIIFITSALLYFIHIHYDRHILTRWRRKIVNFLRRIFWRSL